MASQIAELDAAGFMPLPDETQENFIARVNGILDCHREFDEMLQKEGTLTVFDCVTVSQDEKIDPEIITAAGDLTWQLYRFRTAHVPGFFLSKAVGLLWGGCLIGDPDEHFSLFLIRNSFRTRERWMFYRRTELFAHELCHSMRLELHESTLEEYFAYQTSPSALRRYLGNCFIREWDAILFVLPALLLLGATLARDFFFHALPIWPFWLLAFVYPAFLLIRNAKSRHVVKKAGRQLAAFGIKDISPVLFRCTREELIALGSLKTREEFDIYTQQLCRQQLRWQIIKERFIDSGEQTI